MKKTVVFICLIAMVSLGLASLSIFPEKVSLPITFGNSPSNTVDQAIKYSDCIDSLQLSQHLSKWSHEHSAQSAYVQPIGLSLEKFGQSMDSVVENLNALEAHQFLHAAYKRYGEALQTDSLSQAQIYYHLGAMQICYQLDKSLNQNMGFPKNKR